MTLEDLGYHTGLEDYRIKHNLGTFGVGRVISEHRERYIVKTERNEFEAEVIGNLWFTARDRSEFPAVGDWVAIAEYAEDKALIHAIFPRKSILERTAVGKFGEKQIIATNIDHALIIQAVDRDFNLNRVERYLAICFNSRIKPMLVFNKTDLISPEELLQILKAVNTRSKNLTVIAISNKTRDGYDDLLKHIVKGTTYCLLGSSGVGKSTLVNNIIGRPLMRTETVSTSTNKGRHVTSHRELFVLENGGLLIDNPGMREVGIADAAEGLESAFQEIGRYSRDCRFKDCTHMHESGCAVIQAVANGQIEKASYENYLKMMKEREFFELSLAEKRKKDKNFGRILKDYKKFKKNNE
jgi:ribosome biogenesis GTPase